MRRSRLGIAAVLAILAGVLSANVAVADRSPASRQATTTQTGTDTTGTTPTSPDRSVDFSAKAKRRQKAGRAIKVVVHCGEICQVTASGTLLVRGGKSERTARKAGIFRLKRQTTSLGAGQTRTLKLKLPKRGRRAALNTLRNRGKAKAKLILGASDLAGNKASKTLKVNLRRKTRK